MKLPYSWRRRITHWKQWVSPKIRKFKINYKDVELELYDLNKRVEPYIRILNVFLFCLVLASLVFSFGISASEKWQNFNRYLEIGLLAIFSFIYLTRLILTSQKVAFICSRYLETFLFLVSVFLFFSLFLANLAGQSRMGKLLGEPNNYALILDLVKLALLIFIVAKFIRIVPFLLSARQHPGKILAGSFFVLIMAGTVLLMLPKTTIDGQGLSFIDALFTSTSAVCVTGLIVVDTATHFTLTGQVIILILIQLGGIGIITFATFFALFSTGGIGMGQMAYLRDIVQERNVTQTLNTLKKIIGLTFFVEFLGATGYFWAWQNAFPDFDKRLLFSIFHAVSAFCNAGFALFTNSLADVQNALSLPINFITMLLIIFGGLGFTTIWEVFTGNRRFRHRYSLHSKLVVITSIALIIVGFLGILATEWNGILAEYGIGNKMLLALFQGITPRTAGFNTLDIGALSLGSTMIIMILMAIGASPASTGGGLKTTTFAVLFLTVRSVLRGDDRVEVSKKTIPNDVILKALTSLFLAGISILAGTVILSVTENHPFIDLLFEEISAFSTVGLSRGITGSLSDSGKAVIIVSMFFGRVGSLTIFAAFASRLSKRNYYYPSESVMVS